MKWVKLLDENNKPIPNAIRSGQYKIVKFLAGDNRIYRVWLDSEKIAEIKNDPIRAKLFAHTHQEQSR